MVIGENDPTILLDIPNAAIVTVSAVPLLVQPVPITATEGIALPNAQTVLNGTVVATFLDLGQADSPANYTATIDWGNGQVTPGTIVADGPNFAVLAPANPLILYAEAGTYTVRVTVTDKQVVGGGFFSAYAFSTATVKDAPLTADPIQPVVSAFQQTPLVAVQVAKFTDGNPMAPLSDFTATIDWGDGTPQSAGSFIQPGGIGTAFYVTGNHTYANPTNPPNVPYTITVYIKDVDGATLTTTTTANVQASTIIGTAVTINGVESQPFGGRRRRLLQRHRHPRPALSYSATIDWGTGLPGAVTFGQIVPLGGNNFEVLGTYTYPEENVAPNIPYAVTVTISHNGQLGDHRRQPRQYRRRPAPGRGRPGRFGRGGRVQRDGRLLHRHRPDGYRDRLHRDDQLGRRHPVGRYGRGQRRGLPRLGNRPDLRVGPRLQGRGLVHLQRHRQRRRRSELHVVPDGDRQRRPAHVQRRDPGHQPGNLRVAGVQRRGGHVHRRRPVRPGAPGRHKRLHRQHQLGQRQHLDRHDHADRDRPGAPRSSRSAARNLFEEGTYSVSVVIRDNGGSNTVAFSTITITDSPLTPGTPVPITAVEGKSFTAQVATFTDADALGVISDYAATD